MAIGFIELNDAGIIQAVDGKILNTSPAYAVIDHEELILGLAAQQKSRLLPHWTNNRFWNQLNTDAIADARGAIRHHADIAFAHLEEIWLSMSNKDMTQEIDQLVLGVPEFYDSQQLGLLLGMSKEASIPIVGLVDNALISVAEAAASNTAEQTILHLDISLHRIILTQLTFDGTLQKIESQSIVDTGLFTLWDRWANIVARQFIQSSRFDPMHQADSEQQLFDRIPTWIAQTAGSANRQFDLEVHQFKHTVSVPDDHLQKACVSIYEKIILAIGSLKSKNSISSLYISHRFSGFPGLDKALSGIDHINASYLSDRTASEAAYLYRNQLSSTNDHISLVSSLHIRAAQVQSPKAKEMKKRDETPTHLLYQHIAYAINDVLQVGNLKPDTLVKDSNKPVFSLNFKDQHVFLDIHDPRVTIKRQAGGGLSKSEPSKSEPSKSEPSKRDQVPLKIGDQITFNECNAILIVAD